MGPDLPYLWLQQLAGILPLFALIEFIDVHTKLHLFQLRGSVFIWGWPVTPAGARVVLSKENDDGLCCLDRPTRSATLHCIDCRYGNSYPSSAPTTVRLCVEAQESTQIIPNHSAHMGDPTARKQSLEIIVLRRLNDESTPLEFHVCGRPVHLRALSLHDAVSVLGHGLLVGGVAAAVVFRLYIAAAYLLLMPLTSIAIRLAHGGKPRALLDSQPSVHLRLVVAANSLNEYKWLAVYGESRLVNSLLNKPFSRHTATPRSSSLVSSTLLPLFIGGQWLLALASSALQDWNALIITFWIVFCVLIDGYAYNSTKSVRDWLRKDCRIRFDCIRAPFSSRRSMLSAIISLNPDTAEGCTSWINPILPADSRDRQEWESAVLSTLNPALSDTDVDDVPKDRYWWKFIEEGMEMSSKIKVAIKQLHEQRV